MSVVARDDLEAWGNYILVECLSFFHASIVLYILSFWPFEEVLPKLYTYGLSSLIPQLDCVLYREVSLRISSQSRENDGEYIVDTTS